MTRSQDQQSTVFHELSSLLLNILRSPPIHFADDIPPVDSPSSWRRVAPQITPAGFASLMLGISLALMLCGSLTFFIGLMLLPWVIGLVVLFYFVGFVSSISFLGRSLLCYALSLSSSPPSPQKDIPEWKLL